MSGAARAFFAVAACVLRALARPPLWSADGLARAADACERRAAPPRPVEAKEARP